MSHFLFMSLADRGHVFPQLAVATELIRKGHRVTCATGESMAELVQQAGATMLPCASRFDKTDLYELITATDVSLMLDAMLDDSVEMFNEVRARFDDERPDLLVYDAYSFQVGRVLDHVWGIPTVEWAPTLVSNEHWSYPDAILAMDSTADLDTSGFEALYGRIFALLTDHGIEDPMRTLNTPHDRTLVPIPQAFQVAGETFDQRFAFVGPCLGERASLAEWTPPSSGLPTVLVSFGTVFNRQPEFFRTVVRAFTGVPWHVVITTGGGFDTAELGPLPANIEVHQWISHLSVLEHAQVFVTHGGMGSMMEALHEGRPMVVIPQDRSSRPVARQVGELGLGRVMQPAEVTAQTLRDAVLEVAASRQIDESVRTMQRQVREAGGAVRAAEHLENYLAGRR
ncbi:macrolide family glycosyltransferase [Nocardia sp. NPDC050175]|uniref:macrolide family glycosyltransferase n=1 Tax=Nocardia sp. NPDC050175 TaxID=3364317 RepID=UPI003787F67E